MYILTIKTDNPTSELGLYKDADRLEYYTWLADRQLSKTIHIKIFELLKRNKITHKDLSAVVVFEGPGSFTGLRIGITVANTLAYALKVPIVGSSEPDWALRGVRRLLHGENDQIIKPLYGAEPNITKAKK